jgi:hypothetical protein
MGSARGHDLYVIVGAKPWRCKACKARFTDTEVVHRTMGLCRGKLLKDVARGAALS